MTGTAERAAATTELKKKWSLCSETTQGRKNVAHPALVDKSKIYVPQLNIKLRLIKIFVKSMVKESEWVGYLRQKLPEIRAAKIKDRIFVGP